MNEPIKETKAVTMKDSYPPPIPDTKMNNYFLDWSAIYFVLLAFTAGLIKYLYESLKHGRNFKLIAAIVYSSVSALSGYVMLSLCLFIRATGIIKPDWMDALQPAFIAISGWMGVEFMKKAEESLIPTIMQKISNIFSSIFK